MSEKYEPELGQAMFGQPSQEWGVPRIWEAALRAVGDELCRVMGNIHQAEYASPFGNTEVKFECSAFTAEAYDWDEDREQPFNFKWADVRISWYKYLGRGMSANRKLSADEASCMLDECLDYLLAYEAEQEGKTPPSDAASGGTGS